ncbi:MAG TPA: hypothetical protein VFS40_12035 [Gemmatimonadales bacterium]|nr:hypothetical protein [Gemmatimonadales bacterium]
MSDNRNRDLRAVLRNAVTWAAAWAVAGGALVGAISLFDPRPGIESLPERVGMAAFAAVAWGVRFGLAGGVIGAVFAGVLRFGYRGRRLADINPVRFTLLGAVVGGVGVPLYLQLMNILTGGRPIAWGLVTDDAVWATVFGAVTAAGFILLARRAERLAPAPRPDLLDGVDDLTDLPAPHAPAPPVAAPSRPVPSREAR